ncbi:hypothetical protein G6F57_009077 [Rhizopus arrhizus]|uniref:Reverse transcriptase domain-containing protein n=1 Tax=Rhizopus oryzae TaxID=64495 RepID=A0A9P6X2U0_RHIOR|nr:hypothetical protein G6F23_006213 [Rhizopus arrhizus]KAG1413891.1 hypothetical protein G6F58_007247 [Rhizopus delemar]KAG0758279.1 hypothetical protein G6F24_009900 [Rhizopus arrhizus]KAG0785532.1 hypothetical protein G6F22_007928 [Rhizopus arrhizus]KAG0785768.1 hypothetical protein G6F21_009037 [Rhizopus arrhizus]
MLGKLQQEIATIDGLKAGIRWREQCEKSAGFFKQLHQQRTVQQHTSAVKIFDPQSTFVNADIDVPPDRTSDPVTMRETVQQYYQRLYTTNPVQEVEIEEYLNHINFVDTIDQSDNDTLVTPITMDDLLGQNVGIEYRVKILAYADEIYVILDNASDYHRLHCHLNWYSRVSNAKFNQENTEAFALSGLPNES